MNRIYELQKKIETARHELDEALLQENRFEYYYEKSTRLDKNILRVRRVSGSDN